MGASDYTTGEGYYRVEVAEVEEGLLKLSATARRAVKAYLKEEGVPYLENYAKANAGWEDRTGTARAGLTASVYEKGRASNTRLEQDYTCGVEIYHTAYNDRGQRYGLWLELGAYNVRAGKHNRVFAILKETAREAGAYVVDGMRDILEKYEGFAFGVDDLVVDVDNDADRERY